MQGNIFVISAASGTGKTTLIARLLQHHSDIRVSVSHTTRAPRRGEENGKHYHFVSVPEFERMIEEGQFVEYAKVYGNYYGTSTQSLESLTRQGVDVILEIDTQGAEQIRRLLPQAYSIFIAPPSLVTLEQRLRQRAADAPQVIAVRLAEARNEIERRPHRRRSRPAAHHQIPALPFGKPNSLPHRTARQQQQRLILFFR